MGTLTDFKIETQDISFSDTSQVSISFVNSYASIPYVTATSINVAASSGANVNVYIENLTTTGATIRVSDDNYTGTIQVQIIGN
jgi:hypothetical protein